MIPTIVRCSCIEMVNFSCIQDKLLQSPLFIGISGSFCTVLLHCLTEKRNFFVLFVMLVIKKYRKILMATNVSVSKGKNNNREFPPH